MATAATLRVVEREARVFRKLWRGSVFTFVLTPLLFLAAMGLGLGGLVDERRGEVAGVSYLAFVTPGLLAASAMLAAAGASMWPVMGGLKWTRVFHAMVATPVSAADVYGGWLTWMAIRSAGSTVAFLTVGALLGGVPSTWGVLAAPAGVLCAVAFAAPLAAFSATQEDDSLFPVIMRLGVVPLFLFSGTFFPIDQLPGWLQPLAVVSPLWHGVELCRAATTGDGAWVDLAHVGVLATCVLLGWRWGAQTFTRRLTA